ncbi:MAG: hypothetical protein ACE5DI_05990 [Candidatus Micrarchaeia archaeon]
MSFFILGVLAFAAVNIIRVYFRDSGLEKPFVFLGAGMFFIVLRHLFDFMIMMDHEIGNLIPHGIFEIVFLLLVFYSVHLFKQGLEEMNWKSFPTSKIARPL